MMRKGLHLGLEMVVWLGFSVSVVSKIEQGIGLHHPTISISIFRNAYNSVLTPLLPHLITLIAIYYHPLNPTVT